MKEYRPLIETVVYTAVGVALLAGTQTALLEPYATPLWGLAGILFGKVGLSKPFDLAKLKK